MANADHKTVVPGDPCESGECGGRRADYAVALADAQLASDRVEEACKRRDAIRNEILILGTAAAALGVAYAGCVGIGFFTFFGLAVSACTLIYAAMLVVLGLLVAKGIEYAKADKDLNDKREICQQAQADVVSAYKEMVRKCPPGCVDQFTLPSCACR